MPACLSEFELKRYHAHECSEREQGTARDHLAACAECSRRAAEILSSHDSIVDLLRDAGLPPAAPAATAPSPQLPAAVAGYEIEEEIGRGGQGIVYRAIQRSTKRVVALKVLREGPYASDAARKRFEREVELVAGFRHANIVTVFDSGVAADGRQFCVMDYVRGRRLDAHVRESRLSTRGTLELFATVCDAVNYAHQRGVLHRDLKPSNIVVDEDGVPRVLDFGLAKQLIDDEEAQLTMTEFVGGTLPYLSPEQARGPGGEVDIRSDVYALGVVLYQLLTGRYPYAVDGEMATALRNITETPPASLRRARRAEESSEGNDFADASTLDDEIETIVLKTLSKERERRYQTAGELARDIRRYLAGEPIEAKADSGWYMLRKTLRRYRLPAVVAAVFVVTVSVSAVALALMYARQSQLRADAEAQKIVAQKAQARATRRFNEVRELARTFIFEFHGMITNLPGSTPAREMLVTTALKYVNSLAEDLDANDVQLQAELGSAYMQLADVQGDPLRGNLGDRDGALENYRKSLSLLEAVAGALPDEVRPQVALGVACNRLANLLLSMNRRTEALELFARGRRIFESLRAANPDNPSVMDNLLFNYKVDIGEAERQGRKDEALIGALELLELSRELAEVEPDNWGFQHGVAASHSQIGELMQALGKPAESLTHHLASREKLRTIAASNPNNAIYRRDLATACERVGFGLQQKGDLEGARRSLREALEIQRGLVEADVHDAPAKIGLLKAHSRLGEIDLAEGDAASALGHFEQTMRLAQGMVAAQPADSASLRELAVAQYKMAEVEMMHGKDAGLSLDQRRQHWRSAESWLTRCRGVFTDMTERGLLGSSDAGVADVLSAEIESCQTNAEKLRSPR